MGLEAGTFVNDLTVTNPAGGDGKSQGDDHLRLIKSVLKATFPLAIGARKFQDLTDSAADTLTWTLYRKSATPAPADLLASYAISGDSSTAIERVYARFQAAILTATNGAEDGQILLKTMVAGAEVALMTIDKNAIVMARGFSVTGNCGIVGTLSVTG